MEGAKWIHVGHNNTCEHVNKTLGYQVSVVFVDYLSDYLNCQQGFTGDHPPRFSVTQC